MRLIINKTKIQNLLKIKNIYQKVFSIIKIFPKKLKLRKNKYDFGYKLYILKITNKSIIEKLNNCLATSRFEISQKYSNIGLIKIFLQNNEKKIKKINFKFAKSIKDLFRFKNKGYINLYFYYILINAESNYLVSNKEYINVNLIN